MNRIGLLIIGLVMGMISASAQSTALRTENAEYNDSNKYGSVSINFTVPTGDNTVGKTIRHNLWNDLLAVMGKDIMYGDDNGVPAYSGSEDNLQAMCNYYGSNALKLWYNIMNKEYEENKGYILSDKDMSAEEKKEALANIPRFEMEMKLTKELSTSRYVVFNYDVYGYANGAHGGMYGNFFTFNAKTGQELKEILRSGVTQAMQPLLKKGLKRYFAQSGVRVTSDRQLMEYIDVQGNTIPLPSQYNLCPVKSGILFTYGQYEIASYAAGMPSFVLTYAELKPYMTTTAKSMLGVK